MKTQNKNYCYLMIKPGFSKYEGRIVERLLNASEGAKLVMIGQLQPSDEFNKSFYKHIADKPFFGELNEYMKGNGHNPKTGELMEGPVIYMVIEGGETLIDDLRSVQGLTKNPAPGTIRYDYGVKDIDGTPAPDGTMNVLHCSDSFDNSAREIGHMLNAFAFGAKANVYPSREGETDAELNERLLPIKEFVDEKYYKNGGMDEIEKVITNKDTENSIN